LLTFPEMTVFFEGSDGHTEKTSVPGSLT
jgi:hypothetical protein